MTKIQVNSQGKAYIANGKALIAKEGGGAFIVITSIEGTTLTCGSQTYTLQEGETKHAFPVSLGTYTCTASKSGGTSTQTVIVSENTVYEITLKASDLPFSYQRVEYLQGDGASYLDLGFKNSINYKHTIVSQYSNTSYSSTTALLGARLTTSAGANNNDNLNIFNYNTAARNCVLDYGLRWEVTIPIVANTDYVWVITRTRMIIDNTYQSNLFDKRVSGVVNIYLFALNTNGSVSNIGYDKIKSYTVIDESSSEQVHDFVPCYRKSDNVAGMYDLVTQTFFTNQGTGSFIVGPDVN